ncbi:uncharacterized protein LOC132825601 [Hemiscyllium ocellatum]|uniref:uncharacterized protein LOC132825601 n=1 Tax=Hemiscyllium ocellatum TaxID=170820 RepID=UPI00296772AA|nr:uncharacterized protein LOC132825601 [Hemiscyllium ocellatum]
MQLPDRPPLAPLSRNLGFLRSSHGTAPDHVGPGGLAIADAASHQLSCTELFAESIGKDASLKGMIIPGSGGLLVRASLYVDNVAAFCSDLLSDLALGAKPDCGGVLLPTVTHNTLRYALLMTNSVNGTKCSWILQAASTETLELEVISYQTVSWTDASCTSTYLAIILGPTQKERRFCDPFQSIPEVGRKLVFRGKGTAVVTLQTAYGMKQGFALRYSLLIPDPNRREIDARALELRTVTPLPSAENEQDLSQREGGMYSTSTGQGQLIISQYPGTSNVQERPGSPWIHQVSWYPRRPKLPGILSGQRQRTQTQSQPREIPKRRNSKSDSRTKFHPKSLGCQTSQEKPKISPSLASPKVAAVSESNTRPHPYLTSIIQLLSSYNSSPRSHIPSNPSVYTSPPSPSSSSVYTSSPSPSPSSPSVYTSSSSPSSPSQTLPQPYYSALTFRSLHYHLTISLKIYQVRLQHLHKKTKKM